MAESSRTAKPGTGLARQAVAQARRRSARRRGRAATAAAGRRRSAARCAGTTRSASAPGWLAVRLLPSPGFALVTMISFRPRSAWAWWSVAASFRYCSVATAEARPSWPAPRADQLSSAIALGSSAAFESGSEREPPAAARAGRRRLRHAGGWAVASAATPSERPRDGERRLARRPARRCSAGDAGLGQAGSAPCRRSRGCSAPCRRLIVRLRGIEPPRAAAGDGLALPAFRPPSGLARRSIVTGRAGRSRCLPGRGRRRRSA